MEGVRIPGSPRNRSASRSPKQLPRPVGPTWGQRSVPRGVLRLLLTNRLHTDQALPREIAAPLAPIAFCLACSGSYEVQTPVLSLDRRQSSHRRRMSGFTSKDHRCPRDTRCAKWAAISRAAPDPYGVLFVTASSFSKRPAKANAAPTGDGPAGKLSLRKPPVSRRALGFETPSISIRSSEKDRSHRRRSRWRRSPTRMRHRAPFASPRACPCRIGLASTTDFVS